MKAIFLSASVPNRGSWVGRSDPIIIRDAVLALVAVWAREGELVFGGHPAISPVVEHAARALGCLHNVHIFQSREFEKFIPEAAKKFQNFHWTPVGSDRAQSLIAMRQQMISFRGAYEAAVFIGGMEGVMEELDIFHNKHPAAKLIPVGSTGAAARDLYDKRVGLAQTDGNIRDKLLNTTHYRSLFRELLF